VLPARKPSTDAMSCAATVSVKTPTANVTPLPSGNQSNCAVAYVVVATNNARKPSGSEELRATGGAWAAVVTAIAYPQRALPNGDVCRQRARVAAADGN
jgi:hypothetical protein